MRPKPKSAPAAMESVHTLVTTLASVLLLLAVLRHRPHPLPRRLIAGSVILCLAQVLPLATVAVGPARIDSLVKGRIISEPLEETRYFDMDHIPISEDYLIVESAFGFAGSVGLIVIALGVLAMVRDRIQKETFEISRT